MTETKSERLSILGEFVRDFPGVWKQIPSKGLFVTLLVIWVCFFEFLGNSTLGYINTHSLFAWTNYAYICSVDDEHGLLIPLLVLGLFWWKRGELSKIQARVWFPGLSIIALAILLHLAGYFIQQTRISLAGFFLGLFGLIGVVWGPAALKASFFPMCLFVFALPLGTLAESITHPLRLLATKITAVLAGDVLGINVAQRGTQLFNPDGSFMYEVAAACSGLRSLTAILALCTIYAFLNLDGTLRRLILIASGFPLAIAGNVLRLMAIVLAADAFGQKAGQRVHDSSWFSLLPYVPAIVGIALIGWLLARKSAPSPPAGAIIQPAA